METRDYTYAPVYTLSPTQISRANSSNSEEVRVYL
jgi:hypothetical protein